MQAIGQNIAAGAALLFLITMLFRQVPVLGFFVRMFTRLLLLVSPLMIVVLLVAIVWFHGSRLLFGTTGENAAEEPVRSAAPVLPVTVPLPPERPRD